MLLALLALVLCSLLILAAGPAAAEAAPVDTQPVRLNDEAKAKVDSLTIQAASVQAEIDALDIELEKCSETYNQMQARLDEVNIQMATLRRQLDEAQLDHAYRVKKIEDRICALYKAGGRNNELLELLISCQGINDFINRVRVATTLADQDRRVVEGLTQSTARLNAILVQVDNTKREQLSLRRQVIDQQEQVRAMLAEREAVLENIDAQIRAIIEAEQARQQEEQARLQQALSAILNGTSVYDGSLPQTDSGILNQFLETVAYYIGVPYVWGGDRPSTGFDCSGFTQFVYAQHGVSLPHYSGYQAEMGAPVSPDEIKTGDLLAFGFPVHHVGIYIGDGFFIHAPRTGDVVKISQLSQRTDLAAIRRFELQARNGAPAVW